MKNYIDQNGCHNCKNVFVRIEYDDYPEYYCLLDAPERPASGSVFMGEDFNGSTEEEFDTLYDKWDEWAKKQAVKGYGICDNFSDKASE